MKQKNNNKIMIRNYAKEKKIPSRILILELRKKSIIATITTRIEKDLLDKIYYSLDTKEINKYCHDNNISVQSILQVLNQLYFDPKLNEFDLIPPFLLDFAKNYIIKDQKSISHSLKRAKIHNVHIDEYITSFDIKEQYLNKDMSVYFIKSVHKYFFKFIRRNNHPN